MGEGRSELCLLFASKVEDKFANVPWRPTASGLPLLHDDVLAWAELGLLPDYAIRKALDLKPRIGSAVRIAREAGVKIALGPTTSNGTSTDATSRRSSSCTRPA